MEKHYYHEYYKQERCHWWFSVRSQILSAILRQNTDPNRKYKIIDIGVATGASTELLRAWGDVTPVEYDKDCCEFASRILNTHVHNDSITDLHFEDESFDVVCAFDVIEHVADHRKAVQEMYRVCRKGGWIFITVPALMSLWSQHDVINHHHRRYRRSELLDLFKDLRGTHQRVTYFNSLLFPPIYLFRSISRLFQGKTPKTQVTSDFNVINDQSILGKMSNAILGRIFGLEVSILKDVDLPIGVSLLVLFRKHDSAGAA